MYFTLKIIIVKTQNKKSLLWIPQQGHYVLFRYGWRSHRIVYFIILISYFRLFVFEDLGYVIEDYISCLHFCHL